ncbi:MAG: hypothetical protein U0263_02580 [Polyangiaceae bacterium]
MPISIGATRPLGKAQESERARRYFFRPAGGGGGGPGDFPPGGGGGAFPAPGLLPSFFTSSQAFLSL